MCHTSRNASSKAAAVEGTSQSSTNYHHHHHHSDNDNNDKMNGSVQNPSSSSSLNDTTLWPEDDTSSNNLWQQWTYSYMYRILSTSWHRQPHLDDGDEDDKPSLTYKDLYPVPTSMQSKRLGQEFWKSYQTYMAQSTDKEGHQREWALKRTLWTLAAPSFVPAGWYQFLSISSQVAVPLLVRHVLQSIEAKPTSQVAVWPAFAILAILLLYGMANHRHRHLATKAGITMRAAVLTVLYQHVLLVASATNNATTSSQITNLVAVDTHKLYEVAQEGHLLWALPLAIVMVTTCLLVIMGPVTLVGIGVLVALVPLVQGITHSMARLRARRVACTDQRVAQTTALLQGIKVTKLNHYEKNYGATIKAIRHEECMWLNKEVAVWATTLSVSKLSSALAAAATFAAHVLTGGILTAPTSFSVFLLFSALRFPINYAGRLMGRLAQAQSAVQRLADFLQHVDEQKDSMAERLNSIYADTNTQKTSSFDGPALIVHKGSFAIGDKMHTSGSDGSNIEANTQQIDNPTATENSGFVISCFDFALEKGQVLACCGPVGSGKSTLMQGILGQASRASTNTEVIRQGSLAWVPQTPFILNDTIRENILLGRPYDETLYNQVIQACCLGPDLDTLGPTRDFTEVGERGVTLSG